MGLRLTTPSLTNGSQNKLLHSDRTAHDWYRFILSFPPHLVREYLERLGAGRKDMVLDPFCGTGTTIVECKKQRIPSVGIEAHPMACYAGQVKINWGVNPSGLRAHAARIAERTTRVLLNQGLQDALLSSGPIAAKDNLRTLPPEAEQVLLKNSISPLPLHKALVLNGKIDGGRRDEYYDHERIALARVLVHDVSNLEFGPEVGVGPPKLNAVVVPAWQNAAATIANDIEELSHLQAGSAKILRADARSVSSFLPPRSVDIVITSPPYPNEKDYTRTTRLESVILGFIRNRKDLRAFKEELIRSNTRNVFVRDDDDHWVDTFPVVSSIANRIEKRRKELGKTSGFERLYPRVTRLYFGGMARHLSDLTKVLKPGARLAYVVGDQASYLRILIRTGEILAEIAQSLGYTVSAINLFRTRLATATRQQLREEVVVLEWRP